MTGDMAPCCPTASNGSASDRAILDCVITCPRCGAPSAERMPVDACQIVYQCTACGVLLRPKPGDCCVFCSYGSIPCPPKQTPDAYQAEGQRSSV